MGISPATPPTPPPPSSSSPLLRHLSALTVESSVGSSTLLSFTAATGASACPGADVAMPCDAPPSAPPAPNTTSTLGPSAWGGSGNAGRTRAGTGTVKGVSAAGGGSGGGGSEAAEGGPGSEAARGGVRTATGGGASLQGVSTRCPESCTLSAGGCTDSHTHKKHANPILTTCIFGAIHDNGNTKCAHVNQTQRKGKYQHVMTNESCRKAATIMLDIPIMIRLC